MDRLKYNKGFLYCILEKYDSRNEAHKIKM